MSNLRIRAVSFDLWETLLLEKDGADKLRSAARCQSLCKAFAALDLGISLEEITRAHDALVLWLTGIWEKRREATTADQLNFIVRNSTNCALSLRPEWLDPLTEAYIRPLFEVTPRIDPDAAPILAALRDQGKRIGLISNIGRTPGAALRRFLVKEGYTHYFEAMLFSDEVGVRKPDAGIFQVAAEKLGVKPAEMVHVGDNPIADVWGARNVGMRTVLLSSMVGRDREAEANPSSLISVSTRLEAKLVPTSVTPDATICSLRELPTLITKLDIFQAK